MSPMGGGRKVRGGVQTLASNTAAESIMPLGEILTGPGGVPLFLSPEDRAKHLKKAGLPAGWVLVSRGEFAIIDRNVRHLIGRHNAVAAQARELQLALTAVAVEGQEPTDLEARINQALDLVIPPDLSDEHIEKAPA